jgi:hypothetical protein
MTISSTINKIVYSGDGTTATFPYTFYINANTDLVVQVKNNTTGAITTLTLTTDYTVSGVGAAGGGNVVIVSPSTATPSGTQLIILRKTTLLQQTHYSERDAFPAATHEAALDKLTIISQQLNEQLTRSVSIDPAISGFNAQVVGTTPSAYQIIQVNAAANGLQYVNATGIGIFTFPVSTGLLYQYPAGATIKATLAGTTGQVTVTESPTGTFTFSLPSIITQNTTFSGNNTYSGISTYSGVINEGQGADLASGSTVNLGAATGNYVNITGTTTITAFDTVQAGARRIVKFTGILTLTYNATSLILPGSSNITTAAGDRAIFISLGSGNWICIDYIKANGKSTIPPADSDLTFTDITTNNVSSSAHGYQPKLPNDVTKVMCGDGTYNQVGSSQISANSGSGIPVQVQFAEKTDVFTTSSSTYVDVTGLSVTITPTANTSKILVRAVIHASSGASTLSLFQLLRGSTPIGIGDAASSRNRIGAQCFTANTAEIDTIVLEWVDSPSTTSSTTYKVQCLTNGGGATTSVNASNADTNSSAYCRTASIISVMEIK